MTRQLCSSYIKKYVIGLLIVSICLLTAATSQAASYDWNPAISGGGPAGTWDLLTSNWSLSGGANIAWPNATDSVAVFGVGVAPNTFSAGGAVAVDPGGVTVNAMTFNLNGYSLTGSTSTITLTGTTPAITVTNGGQSASIDANITPTADFTVGGNGDLTLGGNVATNLTGTNRILTKSGTGTLTIGGAAGTGDNAFINLNVTGGKAVLNKTSVLNSVHAVNVVNGVSSGATLQLSGTGGDQIGGNVSGLEGTFDLNGLSETIGALSGTAGTVTNNVATTSTLTLSANTGAFAGTIQNGAAGAGIVALAVSGGNQTLSGNNTYTGGTTLSGGTLNINSNTALGAAAGMFTISGGTLNSTVSGISLTNNNPIALGGNFAFTGTNNLDLGSGNVALNATPTITVNAGVLTFRGIIADGTSSGLTKAAHGTLVLGGVNTYTSTTTITGTLQIDNASALVPAPLISMAVRWPTVPAEHFPCPNPFTISANFGISGGQEIILSNSADVLLGTADRTVTFTGTGNTLTLAGKIVNSSNANRQFNANGPSNTVNLNGGYQLRNAGDTTHAHQLYRRQCQF